ncbi:DUF6382 domain-containing protein [Paenibacillus pabuli]|uniref:DUF6382 domain-containing protein n=1 Tax=Paenibacillus pabuli TaxID=1472 RepID=UPI000780B3B7|nr:DUF6382 domain-containing protein [Paenibacillus pabuli]MEC0128618.1 DUF6382 domain-containing protein [Paenibacillus pabuli]
MYGLKRDFIRNGGAFMVLEKEEGLRMDELSRVQMGMLSSNQIPRLLPVHIRELDRNVTLHYDISGYKMLSQMLKSGKIELHVLYGLLFQLADTFTECRQYMLDSRKLQMQEDYIFIDGSMEQGELGMVYIPIMDTVEIDPTPQQFRELVIRLMAHVQELQGEGIQRVLQMCDSEHWDIRRLRELLLELYADEQSGSGHASVLSSRASSGSVDSKLDRSPLVTPERGDELLSSRTGQNQYRQSNRNNAAGKQMNSRQLPQKSVPEEEISRNNHFSGSSGKHSSGDSSFHSNGARDPSQHRTFDSFQGEVLEEEEKSGSKVTYIILGCMVAMALIWRFIYMEQPGQAQMILSAALSVALLGVAGWVWVTKGKWAKSKSNLQGKKLGEAENADFTEDKEWEQLRNGRFQVERITGGLQKESSNKRSAFFGLGRGGIKQKESKEEMFQESWRWNVSDMSAEGSVKGQGYTNQESFADMHHSRLGNNDVFESEIPLVQHVVEVAAETGDLPRHNAGADATVNLQSMSQGGITGAGPVVPSFYLERRSATGDKNERMDVRGASFVIGRSADMVQWVDSTTGVSRAHVELSRNKSGYVIKDLGSVNGTILQGNVLAPYKEYPLEDGDTFTLAESVYTYRSVG